MPSQSIPLAPLRRPGRYGPVWLLPLLLLSLALLLPGSALARKKANSHAIGLGRPLRVKLFPGPGEAQSVPMKVRALYIGGRRKAFITGEIHEVTGRLFVARRAYRLNDNLPQDDRGSPSWIWQRGGWLQVNRLTGRVSQVRLAGFDPFYSEASWFRDYVAYCGLSDNGKRLSAVVVELGHRKPLLKKALGEASAGDQPDADCQPPRWQRKPVRVTFLPTRAAPQSFAIFEHTWQPVEGSGKQ